MPTQEEKQAFFNTIIALKKFHSINYMEAIVQHCEDVGMEIETAVLLVDDRLKALLAQNAEDLHLMRRIARLPL